VRNVGKKYDIDKPFNDNKVDVYRAVILMQSGMRRFDINSITHIYHDSTKNKLVIKGANSGIIVVTQTNKVMNGFPVYSVTTMYNANRASGPTKIYPRS